MSIETVAVTGGNGTIGRATIAELNAAGYETVNVARGKRREEQSDRYVTTDVTDAGEVYSSLATSDADAIVHMGTIPSPGGTPAHVTYESNAMGTYHVLQAAADLGIDRLCLASSINAMVSYWGPSPVDVEYVPVDEDHPLQPADPYSLGKHAMEITADGFGRRLDSVSIASLRYPWVVSSDDIREELEGASASEDGTGFGGREGLFTYLHLDDAARVARRAIEADLDGHEVFWTVAEDTSRHTTTSDLVEQYYPDATVREELGEHEALVDCSKAEALLGWTPRHSWRDEHD